MESLEQMVDMTAKLFECDRDELYSYILRLCSKSVCVFYFICMCVMENQKKNTHTHNTT